MRIIYASPDNRAGSAGLWGAMIKLALLITTVAIVLAIALIGLFIVLPLLLVGGVALHVYLRYRLRHVQRRKPKDDVIDAEYKIIERQ
jgi:Flp pilus assembly protein TadB